MSSGVNSATTAAAAGGSVELWWFNRAIQGLAGLDCKPLQSCDPNVIGKISPKIRGFLPEWNSLSTAERAMIRLFYTRVVTEYNTANKETPKKLDKWESAKFELVDHLADTEIRLGEKECGIMYGPQNNQLGLAAERGFAEVEALVKVAQQVLKELG
jgi:hypothetical protein